MTALNEQPAQGERFGQLLFDTSGFGATDMRQVQRWTGEYFESPAQYRARGSNACLVLIESLGRAVSAHADIHAIGVRPAIGVVEQDHVKITSPPLFRREL